MMLHAPRDTEPPQTVPPEGLSKARLAVIYGNAFSTGFLVMAFEMLGSRYLIPFFGAGIYTWAALISTVLVALAAGYFFGGLLADRRPSPSLLGAILLLAALWFALAPGLASPMLDGLSVAIRDERVGALMGALGLLFFPMALLGIYSPFAIRLVLRVSEVSGTVAGRIYGISTLGGIAGTLGTTFFLIPWFGTRAITFGLGGVSLFSGLLLLGFQFNPGRMFSPKSGLAVALTLLAGGSMQPTVVAMETPDRETFAPGDLRTLPDGILEERETAFTRIFIRKKGAHLMMTFRMRGKSHIESISNLNKPLVLAASYTKIMTAALLYVPRPNRLLMLGLGGGTTTRYLQRYLPDLFIRAVELDQGVIDLARKYFGIANTPRFSIANQDARVYLRQNAEKYDIIMVDAYRGDRVPFHLMTREFYKLTRSRLTPGGVLIINLIYTTRLFESTIATLSNVFPAVDTYPVQGQVVVVALQRPSPSEKELLRNSEMLQKRFRFTHDLRKVASHRGKIPIQDNPQVLSDDFAPVNFLHGIDRRKRTFRLPAKSFPGLRGGGRRINGWAAAGLSTGLWFPCGFPERHICAHRSARK